MDIEQLESRIGLSMTEIASFCDRWHIGELALFGSILRDDFSNNSDIDLLVTFKPHQTPSLWGVFDMENELEALVGRKVDIVSRNAIENSRNYIRRKAILNDAQVVYGA